MALSLVCKQCNTQLRSVEEAQSHGEVTGHSQFEESTEPVLSLVCTKCGKPCRSQTEKDIHTKRTGHANFVDKTDEATAMDTEGEMKEAAKALKEEAGLGGGSADAADKEVLMVPPPVDVGLRQQLEDMGFSANRATRALHFTGTDNVEQAVNWIMEHENDKDLDEPLLVPEGGPPKRKLSPEEARKEAEELVRKAKANREKEEAELAKVREQERIRSGKELLAAKRLEDELRLKRNVEERRREKEEEARARGRIRQKLEEDRRARRIAKGLPPELTEEEKAAEAAKAKPKAPPAVRMGIAAKPVTLIDNMRSTLVAMKKQYGEGPDAERLKTCQNTLMKYCANVAKDPSEEKFRKIRLSNAAFQTRVGSLQGGVEFLELIGFKRSPDGESLELLRNAVDMEVINAAGAELQNALTNPFFGAL
ncbi:hypothetical protein WJX72_007545 [[Myrmecia] bisecta]|uniref:UBA domain-containing protein n=1 Tax=[Myrmecia] bisecta TaxID=41462 RepID=A0AAW1P3Z4_9CHLO